MPFLDMALTTVLLLDRQVKINDAQRDTNYIYRYTKCQFCDGHVEERELELWSDVDERTERMLSSRVFLKAAAGARRRCHNKLRSGL